MKNRRTVIKFPVFNDYQVVVILSKDTKKTCRALKADDGFCIACVIPGHRKSYLVLGPNGRDADTVSHEASHVIEALFKWTGVKRDEEAFAYHLGYLTGRIHKFLDKCTN